MEKSKKIKSKLINLDIAPYNWLRIKKYIKYFNENPNRTVSKLKYNDLINQALNEYFNEISNNIKI